MLVSALDVAERLGISARTVHRFKACGKLPKPVKIDRSVRWPEAEIHEWIDAGCPIRKDWEAMKWKGVNQ